MCVYACATSHGLTKTYLWLTFHIAHQLHDWRSRCIAWSVSRCWGFVRMWRYKRQESSNEETPQQNSRPKESWQEVRHLLLKRLQRVFFYGASPPAMSSRQPLSACRWCYQLKGLVALWGAFKPFWIHEGDSATHALKFNSTSCGQIDQGLIKLFPPTHWPLRLWV